MLEFIRNSTISFFITPLYTHPLHRPFKLEKEKLRLKILNRLNEEGSNADEPTNIKLSDYSR